MKIQVAVLLILLVTGSVVQGGQQPSQSDGPTAELRDLLLRNAWVHDVRLGRVAVESRTLEFCDGGEVRERIIDDTGIHDAPGTWSLEEEQGRLVLTLAGQALRDRGRFTIKRLPEDAAVELRFDGDKQGLRFERRKGPAPTRCAKPK